MLSPCLLSRYTTAGFSPSRSRLTLLFSNTNLSGRFTAVESRSNAVIKAEKDSSRWALTSSSCV